MSQPNEKQTTTITVFDRMKAEIVSNGQLNRHMLRAAFGPDITDRKFGMAFHYARMQLEEEGYFLKPVKGKSGMYAIATADDVAVSSTSARSMARASRIISIGRTNDDGWPRSA